MRYQSILVSFVLLLSATSGSGQEVKAAEVAGRTGVIQIHQPSSRPSALNKRETSKNFIANQLISIGSQMTITEASEASGLDKDLLKKSVLVTGVPGTDMAKITILNQDQETSRKMFDSNTGAYASRRNRHEKNIAEQTLQTWDEETQRHGDVLHEKQASLTIILQQYGIPYVRDSESTRIGAAEAEGFLKARASLKELEEEKIELQVQVQILAGIDYASMVASAAAFDLPVERIQELHTQHQTLELEIEALKASGDYEDNDLRVLQAKADGTMKNLLKETISLRTIAITRLKLAETRLEKMKEYVTEKKEEAVDLSRQSYKYLSFVKEYELARDLYYEMKDQQHRARIQFRMPRHPITIHAFPE